MKNLLELFGKFILCAIFLNNISASEQPYDLNTAREYLSNIDNIVIAVKIKGELSLGDYMSLYAENISDDFNEDDLNEAWEAGMPKYHNHDLIVLKSFKGDIKGLFHISREVSNWYPVPLGEPMVLFLKKYDNNTYKPVYCGVFSAKKFPKKILKEKSEQLLINHIIDNRLSICLRAK